KPLQIFFL
ncbi:Hypothetical protein EIN_294600, partial [Entamoeba invadens IP1]